jgi:alpha-beta hydrolase superfamily lysophospholipase
MSNSKSIVLVHGGFVDGSGWEPVYSILKKGGFEVIVVQNPTITLADDVAVTRRAIATAKKDVILVGHSYGGAVISEAGNDPKVRSRPYSRIPRPMLLCRHFFRQSMASCYSTGRSSRLPSLRMLSLALLPSWLIRRFHGVLMRCRVLSASRRGAPSQVGTWSRRMTR